MADKTSLPTFLSPEYPLLGLLDQRPAHGYELHHRLTKDLGQLWRVSLSQTYNILNRLEAQGFITGEVERQEKLPARRRFQLTQKGRQRFEAWLAKSSPASGRAIRVEFTSRLYFALARDEQLAHQLIDRQIAETRLALARLEARRAQLPREQVFNRLGLDLRLRQIGLLLDWLEDCHQLVEAGDAT